MPTAILPRSAAAREHTWNAESVFPTVEDWEAELGRVSAGLAALKPYSGRLGQGPQALAEALYLAAALRRRVNVLGAYAAIAYFVDTSDGPAAERYGRAQGLYSQFAAATAFIEPELLSIGEATLQAWMRAEPALAVYGHYFANLFRMQAHVRSAEVEEVLGLLVEPFSGTSTTASLLTDADFQFRLACAADGSELPLTQSSLHDILFGADREARRTAWENYADQHLAYKNTLANNLATSVKQNVFLMRARRHSSSLAASLFEQNIPVEVFHNLIAVFKRNLPTWQRYWRIRRRALGVETLHPYDTWAPLTANRPQIPYEQAVEWICEGMAPLGEEYVRVLRQGCLHDRWVDVYPNLGKFSGAFSWGAQGTYPFIVMSYSDDIFSLSTLAHELGHSLHSYYTWREQPNVYAGYSLFLAEIASNFNQALVRAHLLRANTERDFQISVLEEALYNFHRYLFVMPTLARFELETHERIERGQGLNAGSMISLMADLFAEAYGGEMSVDRERVGINWATFSHLYTDYYVYQYATGISGANALAQRVLSGVPGAAEAYLGFLKAGSSRYPLEVLKSAGVDLSTPEPVEAAFEVLAGLVDRLEKLFD
jgi:oligoendopeptidase F